MDTYYIASCCFMPDNENRIPVQRISIYGKLTTNWEINIRASHYLRIWLSSYDNVQTFLTYGTSDRYGVCRRSKLSRSRSNCSTAFSFMLHVIGLTSWCLLPNKHNVLAQTDTTLQCTQSAFAIMPPKCHRSCWRRHAAQYLLKWKHCCTSSVKYLWLLT